MNKSANKNKTTMAWVSVLALMAFLFISSEMESRPHAREIYGVDKLMHFAAYAVLAGLFFRACVYTWGRKSLGWIAVGATLFAAAYGASDEYHQSFVPTRTCDVYDGLADFLGALTASAGLYAWLKNKP